jgi:NTE family protein
VEGTGAQEGLSPEGRPPRREDVALCLSGGGYRAMLFHLGAIWRLNELGRLRGLSRVSSVSGGSITAAVLGLRWRRLAFDAAGVASNLEEEVVRPVRGLADRTVDVPAVAAGLFLPGGVGARVAAAYRRHLFGDATLQDLPADTEGPRFVINATNLQSGVLWRFSRPYARDYKVGEIAEPKIPLALAVAASSAFPPFLAPVRLRLADSDYVPGSGEGLQHPPFTTHPTLADGGVYDNLGLQTAWSSCGTVLISDGGGAMRADGGALGPFASWRWRDWGTQFVRVLETIDNQVRSLRKHGAIEGFAEPSTGRAHRDGTYWGIRSDIDHYGLPSHLPVDRRRAEALAATPTRLARLDAATQEGLVNWGYAICDTAMRRWVLDGPAAPPAFPYPWR